MSDLDEQFLQDLRNDHSNFDKGKLEGKFPDEPLDLFEHWYKEAFDAQKEANAMNISTVDAMHKPSSRVVYLKEFSNEGFVFYTNYHSHKGKDLAQNPNIAALFFWPSLQREVRIEGKVVKVSAEQSDEYFNSRPRESQLGAWASHQSEKLESREEIEKRLKELGEKFPTKVPRPEHWGGYLIQAEKIEFWQGRPSRLHDRIVYEKTENGWKIYRLNP